MSRIDGRAKKYNGGAIDYVMLFNWSTGSIIGTAKPDASGNWKYYYFSNLNCGITYVADGCEPITHGSYQFNHVERAPFVDFIGTVIKPDRGGSSSADITLVIPDNVVAGDMLVVSLVRRGAVSVSDNNSGSWILGADSFGSPATFEQGTSMYYRLAKVGDAGKTVSIKGNYTDRLIAYLSIYRGKVKQLKVVKTVSNPSRYDGTYKESVKKLAPIEHEGGFILRAVSTPFAVISPNSFASISNMTNTGPTVETSETGQLRLQVAHKHLTSANVLNEITYNTNHSNINDIVADVAIIFDEV